MDLTLTPAEEELIIKQRAAPAQRAWCLRHPDLES
jgi:hypothetical protein